MITVGQRRQLWRMGISAKAKVLIALIIDVQSLERGRCTMSLATLARETGVSRSSVVRTIAALRGHGLVEHKAPGLPTSRTVDVASLFANTPEPLMAHPPEPLMGRPITDPGQPWLTPLSHERLTPRATNGSPPEPPMAHKKREEKRELEARVRSERCEGVRGAPPVAPAEAVVIDTSDRSQLTLVSPARKPPRKRKPKPPAASSATWDAYAAAYAERYQVEPVRNAKVNGQLAQFVGRVGAEEAPAVARFFVDHNARWYVTKAHAVGVMLGDAEKLRTEWVTDRRITSGDAKNAEVMDEFEAQSRRVEALLAQRGTP